MSGVPRKAGIHGVEAARLRREKSTAARFSKLIHSDDRALVEITKQGIGPDVVVHLAEKLRVSPVHFVDYIGLSRATLDRKRRNHGVLGLVESDRVVRYTQLWRQAVHLWGSEAAARQWLTAPEASLGGVSPVEHAATEIGSRQVEDLMGQIANGIAT